MRNPVVIFGTGNLARLARVYLPHDGGRDVAGFTVHRQYITEPNVLGLPVLPFEELTTTHPPGAYDLFVGVGYGMVNRGRSEVYEVCKGLGYTLVTYVSPKATVGPGAQIGDNCFVFEGCVVQPFATVGHDVVLWCGSVVNHDSTVGDHCFLATHAVVNGHVTVGDHCFLGANCVVRDGVTVGAGCVVGAGALVARDAPPGSVLRGSAAEPTPISAHRLRGF